MHARLQSADSIGEQDLTGNDTALDRCVDDAAVAFPTTVLTV